MDNGIGNWNIITPQPIIGPSLPHNFGKFSGGNCGETLNSIPSPSYSLAQQHPNYPQTDFTNGGFRQGQQPQLSTPYRVVFNVSQRKQQNQPQFNSNLSLNVCNSNNSNNQKYSSKSNSGCAPTLLNKPGQDASQFGSSGQILALCAARLDEAFAKAPPLRTGNSSHQENVLKYSVRINNDKIGSIHVIKNDPSRMQSANCSSLTVTDSQSISTPQQKWKQNSQFHFQQQQTQPHQKTSRNLINEILTQNLKVATQLKRMGPPVQTSTTFSKMIATVKQRQLLRKPAAKSSISLKLKNKLEILHCVSGQRSNSPFTKGFKLDVMLQELIEYIGQTKLEAAKLTEGIEAQRKEVRDLLYNIICSKPTIADIPTPISRLETNKNVEKMFDDWVLLRTNENWKFGIFSIVVRVLFDSYNKSVSTASEDDMWRTMRIWIDERCTIQQLTPTVLDALFYVCSKMDSPSNTRYLPEVAYIAAAMTWK